MQFSNLIVRFFPFKAIRGAFLFLFLLFSSISSFAQKLFSIEIQSVDAPDLLKKIPYKKQFVSKIERDKELQSMLFTCFDNAYLTACFDSLYTDSLTLRAFLNFGAQYKWANLKKRKYRRGCFECDWIS